MIGISTLYLNDNEKIKRAAPRVELVKGLAQSLDADLEIINVLAGYSKNTPMPDVAEFIQGKREAVSQLRMITAYSLRNVEITSLKKL